MTHITQTDYNSKPSLYGAKKEREWKTLSRDKERKERDDCKVLLIVVGVIYIHRSALFSIFPFRAFCSKIGEDFFGTFYYSFSKS